MTGLGKAPTAPPLVLGRSGAGPRQTAPCGARFVVSLAEGSPFRKSLALGGRSQVQAGVRGIVASTVGRSFLGAIIHEGTCPPPGLPDRQGQIAPMLRHVSNVVLSMAFLVRVFASLAGFRGESVQRFRDAPWWVLELAVSQVCHRSFTIS